MQRIGSGQVAIFDHPGLDFNSGVDLPKTETQRLTMVVPNGTLGLVVSTKFANPSAEAPVPLQPEGAKMRVRHACHASIVCRDLADANEGAPARNMSMSSVSLQSPVGKADCACDYVGGLWGG